MNENVRHLVYKFQDLEQQFLKTKSNISSKLLERHEQCNTSASGSTLTGVEVHVGILGGGVPPSSPFFIPVFRPDL